MLKVTIGTTLLLFSLGGCLNENGKNTQKENGISTTLNSVVLDDHTDTTSLSSIKYKVPNFEKHVQIIHMSDSLIVGAVNPKSTKTSIEGYSTVITSEDGLSWSEIDIGFEEYLIADIKTVEDTIYAVGRNKVHNKGGFIISSTNGRNWKFVEETSQALTSIVGTNELKIALGVNQTVFASNEPGSWREVILPDTTNMYAGTIINSEYVLVGDISLVKTSNGVDWEVTSLQDVGLENGMRFIVNSGESVVVANTSTIYYSTDMDLWEEAKIEITIKDITFDGRNYYVLSGEDRIYESREGLNWDEVEVHNVSEIEGGVNCKEHQCVVLEDTILVKKL